jgi:hypothetical protein
MIELTMKEYSDQKAAFFKKHCDDRGAIESGRIEGETIYKTQSFYDGHHWEEITVPVYETVEIEKHDIKFIMRVKFYRTEFWDSENLNSRYLYEKA